MWIFPQGVAGFAGIIGLVHRCGWSGEAYPVSPACCVLIGLVNGVLVVHFGVPDFVATMGTLIVGGAGTCSSRVPVRADKVPGYQYTFLKTQILRMLPVLDHGGAVRHRLCGH